MIRILNNWQLKLLSVIAAFLLWFFVVGIENTVYLFPDPVEVQPIQTDKNVSLSEKLSTVKLYLRVDKDQLKNLTKNDFDVSIDLSDLAPGDYHLPVIATSKNPATTIVKVDPSEILVHLAPVTEKEVPVEISHRGNPAVGYRLETAKPDADKVKISGAQSVLQNVQKVEAELIFDGNEKSDVNQSVTLTVPGIENLPKGSVQITPPQMVVTATIVPEKMQKTVPVHVNLTGADAVSEAGKLSVTPSTVVLEGDIDKLNDLSVIETKEVSSKDLAGRTSPMQVDLVFPDGVTIVGPDQKVSIQLNGTPGEQKLVASPVVFSNSNDAFKVTKVTPSQISVTLSGPVDLLKNISDGNVSTNIDLQKLTGGGKTTIAKENILVPAGIDVVDFEPKEVNVEVL